MVAIKNFKYSEKNAKPKPEAKADRYLDTFI